MNAQAPSYAQGTTALFPFCTSNLNRCAMSVQHPRCAKHKLPGVLCAKIMQFALCSFLLFLVRSMHQQCKVQKQCAMCVQHVKCAKHKLHGVHRAKVVQASCEQCFSGTSVLCAQESMHAHILEHIYVRTHMHTCLPSSSTIHPCPPFFQHYSLKQGKFVYSLGSKWSTSLCRYRT